VKFSAVKCFSSDPNCWFVEFQWIEMKGRYLYDSPAAKAHEELHVDDYRRLAYDALESTAKVYEGLCMSFDRATCHKELIEGPARDFHLLDAKHFSIVIRDTTLRGISEADRREYQRQERDTLRLRDDSERAYDEKKEECNALP